MDNIKYTSTEAIDLDTLKLGFSNGQATIYTMMTTEFARKFAEDLIRICDNLNNHSV